MIDPIAKIWDIVVHSLRSNYREAEGQDGPRTFIVPGPSIYQHVYGRDFSFSTPGALLLRDFKPVRDTLATFFDFQRKDGLLPRVLAPWPPYIAAFLEYVGVKLKFNGRIKPYYISEVARYNTDHNALLVWAALSYAKASDDWEFISRRYEALRKAMLWYEGHKRENLVFQIPYSDWQDTIARRGRVFYTNLCYWKGLVSMTELSRKMGRKDEENFWRAKATSTQTLIHSFFWDEEHGFFRNTENIGSFETGANLLAIEWNFATAKQSKRIMEIALSPEVWEKLGPRATVPDYPLSMKSFHAVLSGFAGYHDRKIWSWQVALVGRILHKMNRKDEALRRIQPMAQVFLKDGEIGEVYENTNRFKSWFWRSESPFSWGAGMWVETLVQLGYAPLEIELEKIE